MARTFKPSLEQLSFGPCSNNLALGRLYNNLALGRCSNNLASGRHPLWLTFSLVLGLIRLVSSTVVVLLHCDQFQGPVECLSLPHSVQSHFRHSSVPDIPIYRLLMCCG